MEVDNENNKHDQDDQDLITTLPPSKNKTTLNDRKRPRQQLNNDTNDEPQIIEPTPKRIKLGLNHNHNVSMNDSGHNFNIDDFDNSQDDNLDNLDNLDDLNNSWQQMISTKIIK